MTYSFRAAVAAGIAAFLSTLLPFAAFAQTATSTQQNFTDRWGESSAMQQAIAALGTTPIMALQVPILFGVEIGDFTPNFGDPRPNGRTHEGEDIMADLDTPIISPTAGVVLRTETGVSEGNAVYVAAPAGYTYVYMHLDHFAEGVGAGTVLQAGSLIGYVGNTGDAAGGPTHLHFEVHDPSGTPIDPMPFLTLEFTPAQKISFLTTILGQTTDPVTLSQLLVTNFRNYFTADQSAGITLPPLIMGALNTVPVSVTPVSPSSQQLPAGDLELDSSGPAVVALQTVLINKAVGPAAARLAGAGATGNFGPITEAALIEYQSSVNIVPANGYYGASTRALVESAGTVTPTPAPTPVATPITTAPSSATSVSITRNLYYGISGADVLVLQQFLNAHGFQIAATGAGSAGNETMYFGAATQSAVIRFQIAHSITPSVGYVGPLTRAALSI